MAHTGFVEPQIRFDSMYKTGPQLCWHASGPARRLWENTYDHNSHDSSKEMTKYPYGAMKMQCEKCYKQWSFPSYKKQQTAQEERWWFQGQETEMEVGYHWLYLM